MLVSYNWLKDYLGDAIPSKEKIAELLTFHAFEIESMEAKNGDTVIDVKILPDRSSDCLSQRGIAREIAALVNVPLAHDPLAGIPALMPTDTIAVSITDNEGCPRFTASLIEGIEVKESPQWLKDRLASLGQRSINNIVDATNYVMYAIGQPLHAYDADLFPQVDGKRHFVVRPATPGETVSLLAEGGKEEDRIVTLKGGELLIVEGSTNTPMGLAGVKGGRFAGVHAGTKNIIIEAAHFHPGRTRKTARGLGIVIDASKRFENEPSRNLPPYAQKEIIDLIVKIAGGTFVGYIDEYRIEKHNTEVLVSPERVNAIVGISLSPKAMVDILERLDVTVTEKNGLLACVAPFPRTDLTIPEDYIAEIGRVYGYSHVASLVPETVPLKACNPRHYYSEVIREVLLQQGFSEVITSSFRKKDDIELLSSLASDKRYLRSNLTKNISEVLDKNAPFTDLLGTQDTRVFEIGTVFTKTAHGISEHVALCFGVRVKVSGYSGKEDAVVQAVITSLEARLGTSFAWTIDKGVAEGNFTEVLATLPSPTFYTPVTKSGDSTVQPFSLFPAMSRDIAMWVAEGTEIVAVENVLNQAAGELRMRTTHVDSFTKEGRTSLAFRLVFQAMDRTLTDEEINPIMEGVYRAAEGQGWETR